MYTDVHIHVHVHNTHTHSHTHTHTHTEYRVQNSLSPTCILGYTYNVHVHLSMHHFVLCTVYSYCRPLDWSV